ncbi:hypothetical protein BBO99_00008003 [Phytophthora kernoviae]|uniref:Uncharacterized protein n=2 Tax=Phytophthora kernoviae TaxID=325452 RepID=A0A3R7HEJ7_9STRA|nr:hypothetical protein G195_009225 [Phytophthora kernoviae 00238/432]KAG2512432.1 hypothetical protein JM18_007873 [Phytophthora kernoviae]KAG2515741.1 hypothetical protein JM16_007465 [Phytophthora kernoviae]RLN02978.1 hypothetical protein BBI17_006890 [Phytophthora kernoviae]RLN75860.1 hypothetical protein BBO99_00008003 [Phytophthora kernoviae]
MAAASDASLPVGMQLVSALDDTEALSPVNSSSRATEHVRRALLLPLEGDGALDVEMDIDVDVFRPSAMLDADAFSGDGELFGSSFQPADLGDAEEDIEQMLLCGAEDGLQINHQHDTAPGQADELEKMAGGGAKTTVPKMNMLRGNFQVSPGQDSVPLVKPTPVLPPPYFRGALDSPKKRRAHSKTFNSFAQSLSFSFSNESSANR